MEEEERRKKEGEGDRIDKRSSDIMPRSIVIWYQSTQYDMILY